MKLRNFIRNTIKEMAFKGSLGVIDTNNPEDSYNVSSGLDAHMNGLGPDDNDDYDEWETNYLRKQRSAARAYAGSRAFEIDANKKFERLEADIWVLAKIGGFSEILSHSNFNGEEYKRYFPTKSGTRVNYFNLDQKAIDFLKNSAGNDLKNEINNVTFDDTVIFYSTDGVGSKSNMIIKISPWMLFHAILHNRKTIKEFNELANINDVFDLKLSVPVKTVLTMATARNSLEKLKLKTEFWDYHFDEDLIVEMICQELLGKRGVVINFSKVPKEDFQLLSNIKECVKKYAEIIRNRIKGKLIVVEGTNA